MNRIFRSPLAKLAQITLPGFTWVLILSVRAYLNVSRQSFRNQHFKATGAPNYCIAKLLEIAKKEADRWRKEN